MEQRPRTGAVAPSLPGAAEWPPFVGRTGELKRVVAALERAAQGLGGTVLVTGEAGIGKTRLAREALAPARAHGFRVVEAHAYPLESGLAYAPLIGAFGPLLRALDAARQRSLVQGLPDLGRLFGGLGLPAPEPLGDPALEKTRLFEGVARLVERLTQERPVVLFVDDLHWADAASLELLHYLARGLPGQRALLLATYSGAAMDTARGLRALVRSLKRAGTVEELVIPRLDPAEVAALARGLLGGEAPPELLALLDARAGGTPLFVAALVQELAEAGHLTRTERGYTVEGAAATALPAGVREIILDRLEQLGPVERRVVELVALMGEAAPHFVLRLASGLGEDDLLRALERLRGVGLVAEVVEGTAVAYRLTHPLIQEVAYAELPEMARRRAHAAVVAALEERSPVALDRLARHYLGAGPEANRDRALAVLLAAGEQARGVYAGDEAARHFGAALTLVREGRRPPPDAPYPTPLLPWLLERLGEAWERVGEYGAAVAVWSEALAEQQREGDAIAVARLRRRLSLAEWERSNFAAAQDHLAAGLAALAGRPPCQELVDLYIARWTILGRLGDEAGVAALAEEFWTLAGQLRSPAAEAGAHRVATAVQLWRRDVVAARDSARRFLAAAEEAGDPMLIYRGHDTLVLIALTAGEHRVIREHAGRALALARRLGAPALELLPRQRLVYADTMSGAWERALERSAEALALARRVGQGRSVAVLCAPRAIILTHRGELDEADACLAEARAAFGRGLRADRHVFGIVEIAETVLALARGEVARARALTDGYGHLSEASKSGGGLTAAALPLGLALLGETQVATGAAEDALATARELALFGPGAPATAAQAQRVEGLARLALGESEAATACLSRAAETFAAIEIPFEAARARLEWARAAAAVRPDEAKAAAQQSLAAFERLGARPYVERARRQLQALGVAPPAARRPRPSGGLLSARELEVARLVAEGLTTPEIAERLILSPRTVTTHLDHIYTRLGITSRAALARYVAEAGLFRSGDQNT